MNQATNKFNYYKGDSILSSITDYLTKQNIQFFKKLKEI